MRKASLGRDVQGDVFGACNCDCHRTPNSGCDASAPCQHGLDKRNVGIEKIIVQCVQCPSGAPCWAVQQVVAIVTRRFSTKFGCCLDNLLVTVRSGTRLGLACRMFCEISIRTTCGVLCLVDVYVKHVSCDWLVWVRWIPAGAATTSSSCLFIGWSNLAFDHLAFGSLCCIPVATVSCCLE